MAIEKSDGKPGLNYRAFRKKLETEGFTGQQSGFLKLRLDLMESFMEISSIPGSQTVDEKMPIFDDSAAGHIAKQAWYAARNRTILKEREQNFAWTFEPGSLTIIDLSCPFVDANAACALFTICLELFLEKREETGRVVALDEAHKVCRFDSFTRADN